MSDTKPCRTCFHLLQQDEFTRGQPDCKACRRAKDKHQRALAKVQGKSDDTIEELRSVISMIQEQHRTHLDNITVGYESRIRNLESEISSLKAYHKTLLDDSISAYEARIRDLESNITSLESRHKIELDNITTTLQSRIRDLDATIVSLRSEQVLLNPRLRGRPYLDIMGLSPYLQSNAPTERGLAKFIVYADEPPGPYHIDIYGSAIYVDKCSKTGCMIFHLSNQDNPLIGNSSIYKRKLAVAP